MVNKNETITAGQWNALSKSLANIAKEKEMKIFHTGSNMSERKELKPEDEIVKPNERIKTDQLIDLVGAFNQLETSFEKNCCQRQCHCESECNMICQSIDSDVRWNYTYSTQECKHRNCIHDALTCQKNGCQKMRECTKQQGECNQYWQKECKNCILTGECKSHWWECKGQYYERTQCSQCHNYIGFGQCHQCDPAGNRVMNFKEG